MMYFLLIPPVIYAVLVASVCRVIVNSVSFGEARKMITRFGCIMIFKFDYIPYYLLYT